MKRILLTLLILCPATGNDFSADPNCVALYNLDDGALTTDSIGTNTLTNSHVVNSTVTYKEGDASAYADVATDQLYRTDADLSSDFPGKSGTTNRTLSVCAWIRPDDVSTFHYVASKYSTEDSKRTWGVYVTEGNVKLAIGYNSGSSAETFVHSTLTLSTDQWYHIGVTYNGSTGAWRIRVWDDDASSVSESTGTGAQTMNLEGTEFTLFARDDNSNGMTGYLDEVVIFDDVLTADDIDEIRSGTSGTTPAANIASVGGVTWASISTVGDVAQSSIASVGEVAP